MDTNENRERTRIKTKKRIQPQMYADLGIAENIGSFSLAWLIGFNALKVGLASEARSTAGATY